MNKIFCIRSSLFFTKPDYVCFVKMEDSADILNVKLDDSRQLFIDFIASSAKTDNIRKFVVKSYYSDIAEYEKYICSLPDKSGTPKGFLFEQKIEFMPDDFIVNSMILHEDTDGELVWTTQYSINKK